jgi:protein-disulfide isomerase
VKKIVLFLSAAIAPLYLFAADRPSDVHTSIDTPVVEINGTKMTVSDLEHKNPGSLFQARNSFYEAQKKAVDQFVDEYLLEAQAKKEGVTVTQLLEKHVTATIAKDPSEEALHVYYEGVDTAEPYESVRGKIVEALRTRRIQKAKAAYLQSLHAQATVSVLLAPPRADISLKDTPVRGAAAAPVTLVEYADYECPYCQQIQPALEKLQQDYKGKLIFAYKDVPLPMHSHAEKAAEASHCADAQGKYWEFHDVLYAKKELEVPALKQTARSLNLDGSAFDKCLDSGEKSEAIRLVVNEANGLGLQGTPTFFINGRYFSGTASYESLRQVVEEELAKPAARQMASR